MVTTVDIRENTAWLESQGYSVDIIFEPAQRVQWYRADGTALPALLPCDPYHLRQFRRKGWTLKPLSNDGGKAPLYIKEEKPGVATATKRRRGRPAKKEQEGKNVSI